MTLMTGADNRSVNGMPGGYMKPGSAYAAYFHHVRAQQMGDALTDSDLSPIRYFCAKTF